MIKNLRMDLFQALLINQHAIRALDHSIGSGVCPVREGVHAQQGASVGVGGQEAEAEGDHLQPEASTQHVVDLHTARLQNVCRV